MNEICPFRVCGDNEKIPGGALQCRHVLHIAKSAILPSGIAVPVNEDECQAGNQNKSKGRSAEGAPVLDHSASNHTAVSGTFRGNSGTVTKFAQT